MAETNTSRSRPLPTLPNEPAVLRHSFEVLVGGGLLALIAFGVAYHLEGGGAFGARFEVGLRAATGVAATTAGLLTWSRLELSRREHHLTADAELTERFGRSLSQLGDADPVIRVGGVFAMERFALDAAARAGDRRDVDWRMALDLLAAFVRRHSAVAHTAEHQDSDRVEPDSSPIDVTEAARVLGRFQGRCSIPVVSPYDLTYANLTDANLSGANLAGARLAGAFLVRADLSLANLTDAVFIRADLTRAFLFDADLSGAQLAYANLSGADLTDASLGHRADLSGANLTDAIFYRADLRGANLSGADLTGAVLCRADLTGSHLNGANLERADLNGADLTGAHINHANLVGVNLTNIKLYGPVFYGKTNWPDGTNEPPEGILAEAAITSISIAPIIPRDVRQAPTPYDDTLVASRRHLLRSMGLSRDDKE